MIWLPISHKTTDLPHVLLMRLFFSLQAQAQGKAPWALSFSFGRALQASVLKLWSADQTQVEAAQNLAVALARANSLASLGKYEGPHPSASSGSLHETFRGWGGAAPVPAAAGAAQ